MNKIIKGLSSDVSMRLATVYSQCLLMLDLIWLLLFPYSRINVTFLNIDQNWIKNLSL